MNIKVPRLYSGSDEESHWDEIEIAMERAGQAATSVLQTGDGIAFVHVEGDARIDWHTAPRRQFVITLGGTVEYETGDGSKRLFGPGDVFLADDLTGRGHAARCHDLVQALVPVDTP
jgi:hypothetical protein